MVRLHFQKLVARLLAVYLVKGVCVLALPQQEGFSSSSAKSSYTYDYVVVGGGTAGLTLAARLSEDNFANVAVIEAGSYYQITNPMLSSTPLGDVFWIGSSPQDVNPGVDWGFVTTAQAGASGRSLHYPRGKCLGGSSGRNYMIYQRPDKGSMQKWAEAVGDQSFTFDNLLPYFKKSVNFTSPGPSRAKNATALYDANAFSAGGPLQVSYPAYAGPFSTFLGGAFSEIGINSTKDFNSGSLMGSQYCSSTIDPYTGFRSSSQTSFLESSQARPNLKVFYNTLVKKVLFDPSKRATGVELSTGITLNARKEVILSAGAFQSPQLLMISGVGPKETLQRFNIPVVADRPGVGQNMTDHIMYGPSYEVTTDTLGTIIGSPVAIFNELTQNYFTKAEGPLTNPVTEWLAWEKIPRNLITPATSKALSTLPASWPEIEYISSAGYVGDFSSLLFNPNTPRSGNYASILGALVAPLSRGNITIGSASASDAPIINPNWLTHPIDKELAVASFKRIRAAFATKAMSPALVSPIEYFPGPDVKTDEQILDSISKIMHTVFHASGTCRMGKANEATAVVDTSFRVIGVKGLRVVDASAFALLPPGHPQSLVYALAEKAADEIKKGR